MTAIMCGQAGAVAASSTREDEIGMVSRTYSHNYVSGTLAITSVTLTMNSNGDLVVTFPGGLGTTSGTPNADEWHVDNTSAGLGNDWDVRATVTSGALTSGSTAWQQLNANRAWTVTQPAAEGTTTATLTFDFRLNGTTPILVTVTGVVLTAFVAFL